MTTRLLYPAAAVTVDGDLAPVTDGTVTLDEGWAPYAQGQLVLSLDAATALAIDPREGDRCQLSAGVSATGTDARPFDLSIRSRVFDYQARTATLQVASDEGLAQDYAPLADDQTPLTFAGSLRAVCDYTLSQVGGISHNLISNPRGTTISGWSANVGGGGSVPTRTAETTPGMNVGGLGIDTFIRAQAVDAGTYIDIRNTSGQGVLTGAGSSVTVSAYVRTTSISAPTTTTYIQFIDSGGATIATRSQVQAITSGQWTRIYASAPIVDGTVRVVAIFRVNSPVVAGSRLDATAFLIDESANLTPWKEKVLAQGSADADMTPLWDLTNLVPNPVFGVDLTGYTAGSGASALTRLTGGVYPLAQVLRWTGAAGSSFIQGPALNVSQGQVMTAFMQVGSGATVRTARVMARFRNAAGGTMFDSYGPSMPTGLNPTYNTIAYTFATPPQVASVVLFLQVTDGAASQLHYTGAWHLVPGAFTTTPISGDHPADPNYTYAWTGTAHASSSTRTVTGGFERTPDALVWSAGVSAWDFLAPLMTASGLRLFCDELRTWRLVPEEYDTPGTVTVTAEQATEGNDTVSREDASLWCEGVVVRYDWTDANSIRRWRIDTAGVPGKVLRVNYQRPYPGPGAAAAILSRMGARGRVQTTTALTVQAASPGMESRTSLPDGGLIVGRVRAVIFHLSTGLMDVQARQQTEVPPGSWAQVAPGLRWMDLTGDLSWNEMTP